MADKKEQAEKERERETKILVARKREEFAKDFFDTASPVYLRSSRARLQVISRGGISGGLCVRNFIRMIDEKNRAAIPFR